MKRLCLERGSAASKRRSFALCENRAWQARRTISRMLLRRLPHGRCFGRLDRLGGAFAFPDGRPQALIATLDTVRLPWHMSAALPRRGRL